jgi:hypothetical protein
MGTKRVPIRRQSTTISPEALRLYRAMKLEKDDRSDDYFKMDRELRALLGCKPWHYPTFDENEVPPSWGDRAAREAYERFLALEQALAAEDEGKV